MTDTTKIITIPSAPPKMVLLNCKVDLTKMCRTCGEKCIENVSLLHICKSTTEEIKISKMLTTCTSLQVRLGDGLPMIICLNCMNNLINVYQFVQKCKNTDIKMRKYVFDDHCSYLSDTNKSKSHSNNYTCNTIQLNTKYNDIESEIIEKNNIIDDEKNSVVKEEISGIINEEKKIISEDKNITNEKKTTKRVYKRKHVKIIESLRNKIDPNKDIIFNEDFEIILNDSEKIENEDTNINEEAFSIYDYIMQDHNYHLVNEAIQKQNSCDNTKKISTKSDTVLKNNISETVKFCRFTKDCPYCSQTFSRFDTYKIHIKLHAGIFPFKCDSCDKQYKFRKQLCQHKKVKHPLNLNLKMQCRRLDCGQLFPSWPELKEHIKTHPPKFYQCEICEKKYTQRIGYITHQKMHLGIREKFPCKICGKILRSQSSAYMHSRYHKKQYSLLCTLCGKGFYTPFGLRKHSASHSDVKLYQCELCGKGLKSLNSLKLHKLSAHIKTRNVSCELCSRKFLHKHQLTSHMQRHNKEYKYSCEVCGHKVYTSRELKIHKFSHTGERPMKCSKCPKTYTRPQLYRQHMARHSGPFTQCDICYSFLRPEYFVKHRMGHENKKKTDENLSTIDVIRKDED